MMRSLRRDLFEHKLWPVVALLLVAVIAVPLFMLKGAPAANGTPTPTPPHLTVTTPAGTMPTVPVKVLVASVPRNPFASGMPKLTTKPASQTKAPAGGSSSTTTTSSSTTTAPAAMVSPSPATTSTTPSAPTPAAATPPAATTTTPATTVTTAPSTPEATPAAIESWTLYAVAVRFGKDTTVPIRKDLARLTPLPSAKQPEVMFMGVMAGGRQAVFTLGTGITHTGPGLCRPDRTRCSAIVLQNGQTERLTVPAADSTKAPRHLVLRLVHVYSSVTHSRVAALGAYKRHSKAGLCDLDLASPVSYSPTTGTLSTAATAACKNQQSAVPFPTP
jgi:hypothetical protein